MAPFDVEWGIALVFLNLARGSLEDFITCHNKVQLVRYNEGERTDMV